MLSNYSDLADAINGKLVQMRKEMPETVKGFSQMTAAAHTDGVLNQKQKELIAMGIAVALRCQGCLAFHAKALVNLGCSRKEFMEMLEVAAYMGGGPSLMTSAEALKAYEDFGGEKA